MPVSLQFDRFYASVIVTVTDVRCRPHDTCRSAEETSSTNDIVFPRSGCFVRHVHRRQTVADANTVLFFRKHEPYHITHPVSGGDDCTCLSFAPDLLADAFGTFDCSVVDHPDAPFRVARTLSTTETLVTLYQLRRTIGQLRCAGNGSSSLPVDEAAIQMLETLARVGGQSKTRSNGPARLTTTQAHRELAEDACVVLSERMGDPLTLAKIARCVHSSPFHLARVFRRMTGLSLKQYLTRLRLRAALEPLADGEPDLTALALALGFASHSHFSDAFRREFNVTPSAFRLGLQSRHVREMSTILKAPPSRSR